MNEKEKKRKKGYPFSSGKTFNKIDKEDEKKISPKNPPRYGVYSQN